MKNSIIIAKNPFQENYNPHLEQQGKSLGAWQAVTGLPFLTE